MPDGKPGGVPADRPPTEDFSRLVERVMSEQDFDGTIAAAIRRRLPSGRVSDREILEAVRRRVKPRVIEVLRGFFA